MSAALTDQLVDAMQRCPDEATRKRLAPIIRELRKADEPQPKTRVTNPRHRASDADHVVAVAAGKAARAKGLGRSEASAYTGDLRLRNAWLAGWNDEDIKRGGK